MVRDAERRHLLLLVLLLLIGVFNVLDFAATQDLVVRRARGMEPYAEVRTPFSLYKLLAIPLGLLFLWLVRQQMSPKLLGAVAFTCGVYALVLIYTVVVFTYLNRLVDETDMEVVFRCGCSAWGWSWGVSSTS